MPLRIEAISFRPAQLAEAQPVVVAALERLVESVRALVDEPTVSG